MVLLRCCVAATLLMAAVTPASAAGKADKIRELLSATNAAAMAAQMASAVSAQILPMAQQANPNIPPAAWTVFSQEINAGFEAAAPGLTDAMVPIYDHHFSEAEIDDLLAFYQSPTGRKAVTRMPVLMQEGMAAGQRMAPQIAQQAVQRAMGRLKDMGYQLK